MKVTVFVFAHLKEYFDAQFEVEVADGASVQDAIETLARLRPTAAEVLRSSRVAVEESIVPAEFVLRGGSELFVLPPSSGG